MYRLLLAAACCLATLFPGTATALADPSPQLQSTGAPTWADVVSYSSINVPVSCAVGQEPTTSDRCAGDVAVLAAPANPDTGQATGAQVAVGSLAVDLAVGESRVLAVATPVTALRNPMLLVGAHVAVVEVRLSTAGVLTGGSHLVSFVALPPSVCRLPALVGYSGAPLLYRRPGSHATATELRSPVLDLFTQADVVADRGPMSFTLFGLTYSVDQGTRFRISCVAVNAVRHGAWMPTISLQSGSIHITGRPTGPQLAATVSTPEGNLGSRRVERVDLVVARDPAQRVSTLRVKRGASGQITPVHTSKGSPCTSGSSLRVNRVGRITAA